MMQPFYTLLWVIFTSLSEFLGCLGGVVDGAGVNLVTTQIW